MKFITKEMIKIYNLDKFDFMGFNLTKQATFHHIHKKEHGGGYTIANGAVLDTLSHSYIHLIETRELSLYKDINTIFKIINKKGVVSYEDIQIIYSLLDIFEAEHSKDKTSKGKILIKEEYKKGRYFK